MGDNVFSLSSDLQGYVTVALNNELFDRLYYQLDLEINLNLSCLSNIAAQTISRAKAEVKGLRFDRVEASSIITIEAYHWRCGFFLETDNTEILILFPWRREMKKSLYASAQTEKKSAVESDPTAKRCWSITAYYKLKESGSDKTALADISDTVKYMTAEFLERKNGLKDNRGVI